jgi:DNA replication protein DnaC
MAAEIDFDEVERHEDTLTAIPHDFRWARFRDPMLRKRVKPESAVDEAAAVKELPIVLLGKAGAGKTALGCALLRRFAKRLSKLGAYADATQLSYARRMFPLGAGEAPEVRAAMDAGVLFLDELGAEEGIDQTIVQLIRMRFRKPTIIATPHDARVLTSRYGSGIGRRIFEDATVIRLAGAK